MNSKVIIGCGYLGRRIAQAWLGQGSEVFALTRSPERAREFTAAGLRPMIGDVTDPQSLEQLPDAATVLYAIGFDRTSGKSFRNVYVDGLENVLKQMAGRIGRFLYVSSTSVYGQDNGEWIDETSPCEPLTANGGCCLEAEGLVLRHFNSLPKTGTPTTERPDEAIIGRLSGIYGPGRLLARIAALRAGEPLSGNLDSWLNLIHVDDAVNALLACEQRGLPGETYLISDDRPIRRRDYYRLLSQQIGAPEPRSTQDETSPSLNKRCSNRKLREQLKVTLRFPTIAEGLPQALSQPL